MPRLDATWGWRLSETPRGERWIENFEPRDQRIARRLVDALQIYRADIMDLQLMEKVESEIQNGRIELPVVITIANSLEDFRLPRASQSSKSPRKYKGRLADPKIDVVFDTFDPGGDISALPGSEGGLGVAVRDFLKRSKKGVYFLGGSSETANYSTRRLTSIDQLREKRIRTILVLADYSATGDQVEGYIRTIVRHPSIASWRSLKRTKIIVLAHTLTAVARQRITRPASPVDDLITIANAPTIDSTFLKYEENKEVKCLCRKYAKRAKMALGYRSSGALFLTTRSVPNNLPEIFLRKEVEGIGSKKQWSALFASRAFPEDLAKYITGTEIEKDLGLSASILYSNDRISESSYKFRDIAKTIIGFLDLVSKRPSLTRVKAYEIIPWDRHEIDQIVEKCEGWGLLEGDGDEFRLTAEGLHALYSARQGYSQKARKEIKSIDMGRQLYYPKWR